MGHLQTQHGYFYTAACWSRPLFSSASAGRQAENILLQQHPSSGARVLSRDLIYLQRANLYS